MIWGTGGYYREHYAQLIQNQGRGFSVLGFIDNDSTKWDTQCDGLPVYAPSYLGEVEVDAVLISSGAKRDIFNQLCRQHPTRLELLKNTYDLHYYYFEHQGYHQRTWTYRINNWFIEKRLKMLEERLK